MEHIRISIRIRKASHATHHTKNVVIHGIHANLSSVGALNGGVGENKLQSGVVNTREVARAGGLVLLGSQCERIQVDTGIRGAGVVLVRLNQVEVGSLTLREAVLAVKLELSGDDGILTPAVHVERSLGEHEGSGIRDAGSRTRSNKVRKFRTPGGKLSIQYTSKRNALRVCGDTQVPLNGISRARNAQFRNLSKKSRTVSRPYGGSLSHEAVKHRIMRAFFNEELKVLKQGATTSKKGKRNMESREKKWTGGL